MCGDQNSNGDCMDCKNELNLCKLCVKHIKADKIKVKCLDAGDLSLENFHANAATLSNLCSSSAQFESAKSEDFTCNDLCVTGKTWLADASADALNSNSFCAKTGTINDLCVTNLSVMNQSLFSQYRAAATNSASSVYTLGTPINWNQILDDPNSNVALSPFSYTAPVAGYYSASFHIESDTLAGTAVIAGTPVGVLTLLVNGLPYETQQTTYLSFSDAQSASLSTLALLNAGDKVTMKYEVFVQGPPQTFIGTINLKASGAYTNSSSFAIHLLSSLAAGPTPKTCATCPLVEIPCSQVNVNCSSTNPDCNRGSWKS